MIGQTTLSRRAALSGALALAPAAATAALPVAIDHDAELLELIELKKELDAAAAVVDKLREGDDEEAWEDALQDAGEIAGDIMDTPTKTLAGLRIKAEVCWWHIGGNWKHCEARGRDPICWDTGHEAHLLAALLKDLIPDLIAA